MSDFEAIIKDFQDINSLLCAPYGEKTEKLDNIIRNLSDILSYKK